MNDSTVSINTYPVFYNNANNTSTATFLSTSGTTDYYISSSTSSYSITTKFLNSEVRDNLEPKPNYIDNTILFDDSNWEVKPVTPFSTFINHEYNNAPRCRRCKCRNWEIDNFGSLATCLNCGLNINLNILYKRRIRYSYLDCITYNELDITHMSLVFINRVRNNYTCRRCYDNIYGGFICRLIDERPSYNMSIKGLYQIANIEKILYKKIQCEKPPHYIFADTIFVCQFGHFHKIN